MCRIVWSRYFKSTLTFEEKKILPKLPQFYQKLLFERLTKQPEPVHYIADPGRWKFDPKTKSKIPAQNVPVNVLHPNERHQGIWANEGIVLGLTKRRNAPDYARPFGKVWLPKLSRRMVISEILGRKMVVVVTSRTLDKLDENYGLDHYILKSHEVDLNSKFCWDLKREMLLCLHDWPQDSADSEKNHIYETYKKYLVYSRYDCEWIGLTLDEAVEKYKRENNFYLKRPLKEVYADKLFEETQAVDQGS